MKKYHVHSLMLGAALLAVPLAYAGSVESTGTRPGHEGTLQKMDSYYIHDLLRQAKVHAGELRVDAEQMESFRFSEISWESHVAKVSEIRTHVNNMGRVVGKLEHLRPAASEWQARAIDRMVPVLKNLAYSVQNTIDYLARERSTDLRRPEHRQNLSISADLATTLEAMVRDYVDYGETRQKLSRLSTELEMPAAPQS